MAISVSNATLLQAPVAVQPAAARQPAPAPKPQPPATDTVQISAAAKALQEKTQAPAQTVKAAAPGDVQAKALLAKEAAAQTITK